MTTPRSSAGSAAAGSASSVTPLLPSSSRFQEPVPERATGSQGATASHPLDDPLAAHDGQAAGGGRAASALGIRAPPPSRLFGHDDDVPASYQSRGTLRGGHFNTMHGSRALEDDTNAYTARPGYFDLQRLAAQADGSEQWKSMPSTPHLSAAFLVPHERRRSGANTPSASASTVHETTSSFGESNTQYSSEDEEEEDGTPSWLRSMEVMAEQGRPASRASRAGRASDLGIAVGSLRSQSRPTRTPSRSGALSPVSVMAAGRTAQNQTSFGTLSRRQRTRTDSASEQAYPDFPVAEDADVDVYGSSDAEKPLQFFVSLHRLTDDELDRHWLISTDNVARTAKDVRPSASPVQHAASSGSHSPSDARSVSESVFSSSTNFDNLIKRERRAHTGPSNKRFGLLRGLSQALDEAQKEAALWKSAYNDEMLKHAANMSAARKSYEAKEEAMRDILTSAGVSKARVDRALTHAQAQASVPVFKADERMTEQLRRARSPPLKDASVTAASTSRHVSGEDRLPASLMEAMQDDLQNGDDATRHRSPSTMSRHGTLRPRPVAATRSVSSNDDEAQRPVGPVDRLSPSASSHSQARTSSASAQSPATTPGTSATGLMPWAPGTSSRKAVASVQASVSSPAYTNLDNQKQAESVLQASRPVRSRAGSRSSVASQAESHTSEAAYEHDDDEAADETKTHVDVASPRSNGFDFLLSLGWRRKRPKQTKGPSDASVATNATAPNSTIRQTRSAASDAVHGAKNPSAIDSSAESGLGITSEPAKATRLLQEHEDGSHETFRAKSNGVRPQPKTTVSGRDVAKALHEAIGSNPPSPESQHSLNTSGNVNQLPKPPHFKAIFLATRIMTPDPASLVLDGGKATSAAISGAAMDLVRRARDEGKVISDATVTSRSRSKQQRRTATDAFSRGEAPRDIDARPSRPTPANAGSAASSTAATLSRALTRYALAGRKPAEPNVTRLPGLFGLGLALGSAPSVSTNERILKVNPSTEVSSEGQGDRTETATPLPLVTELEPILADDARPPTFSLGKHHSISKAGQHTRHGSLHGRQGRSDTGSNSGDESSGDEFEVYGGKHLDTRQIRTLATSIHRSREAGESSLLTDRYGFVYDATPADVRLLRRARHEATHAPACLTGIRVGVRARGGSDSDSDSGKDAAVAPDTDSEAEQSSVSQSVKPADSTIIAEPESPSASDKFAVDAAKTRPQAKATKGRGLLDVQSGKPSIGAVNLDAAKQSSIKSGPTSPSQERLLLFGDNGASEEVARPNESKNAGSGRRQPTTSQTVRRLLGQLQDMHADQQATQQAQWDAFLERRKAALRERTDTNAQTNATSSAQGVVDAVRKGGGALGLAYASTGSTVSSPSSSTARRPVSIDEHWTFGGLIGINNMGVNSKDHQDFCKLIQGGIPLVYRPKVWYECSGAGELTEPGRYEELLKEHKNVENICTNQIDLDVGRTMPTNVYFSGDGPGVPKLRRLLVAFSWYNTRCGYCQGMNNLAATLLLTHATEEEAFWVLACIIEVSSRVL